MDATLQLDAPTAAPMATNTPASRVHELVDLALRHDATSIDDPIRLQPLAAVRDWTSEHSRMLLAFVRQSARRPARFQAIALAGALTLVPRADPRPDPRGPRGQRLMRWSLLHAIDLQAELGLRSNTDAWRFYRRCRQGVVVHDPFVPHRGLP
jgi:hypothetical protein